MEFGSSDFTETKKLDIETIHPKFMKIMDGEISPLHPWIAEEDDGLSIEDRRGEMAWSYNAGGFEGIIEEYVKSKGG